MRFRFGFASQPSGQRVVAIGRDGGIGDYMYILGQFGTEGLVEEVAQHEVTGTGEVYFVLLRQLRFLPFLHGFEASHYLELVPYGAASLLCQSIAYLLYLQPVAVDTVAAAASLAVAVVVGDEYKGTLGIDVAYRVAQSQVVVLELNRIEVGAMSVVNVNKLLDDYLDIED